MNSITFLPRYFFWHYTRSFKNLWGIWMNFFWFIYNFFSIPLLGRTLFAPWQRMGEEYHKGLDLAALGSTLIVNSLMRIVGFVMRFIVIVIGLISILFVFLLGVASFVIWFFYPLIVLALLAEGIIYLI